MERRREGEPGRVGGEKGSRERGRERGKRKREKRERKRERDTISQIQIGGISSVLVMVMLSTIIDLRGFHLVN